MTAADKTSPSSGGRIHAILGMHRSGTSFFAGALQELGLPLGEVTTQDPHNARGNRENPELMRLHDQVLQDNGGDWKHPPRLPTMWAPARRDALKDFIARMNRRHDVWGFKDPRALLTLDEWRRQAPGLGRAGIFRHPLAVWRSLAARNSANTREFCLRLWTIYNRALVAEYRRSPFPIIRFDAPPPRLLADVQRVAVRLALPEADRPTSFWESRLAHHGDTSQAPVPETCLPLWTELTAIAEAG